jgi:hypothetical protein
MVRAQLAMMAGGFEQIVVLNSIRHMPTLGDIWDNARRKLTWFGGIYALLVLILALPGAQKQ